MENNRSMEEYREGPVYAADPPMKHQSSALGIVALVTGIIGVVLSFCCTPLGLIMGIIALVCGIIGQIQGQKFSVAGIVLGVISIPLSIISAFIGFLSWY